MATSFRNSVSKTSDEVPFCDTVYRKADFTRGLNVSLENDDVACEIKGIALLQDKIIILDQANSKLKVFSRTYSFLFEHKCNTKPRDIDKLDDTRIVVTFWGCNFKLYTVGNDYLKELINVKTDHVFVGVGCYEGKIYCVNKTEIGSKDVSKICVYTPDGILRRRFEYLSDGGTYFNNLQYINVNHKTGIVYVTDWNKGVVTLTTKGEVLTCMSPTELKNPQGIAIDDHGQIYVCGCISNNLLQMSADGKESIDMLSSDPRSELAQCVKVCGNQLFLARRHSDVISIYQLS